MPPLRRAAWPDTSERSVFPARRYNEPDFLLSCLAENHYTHRYYETCNARASLCVGSTCSEDERGDVRIPLRETPANIRGQPEPADRRHALRGDVPRGDHPQGGRRHLQQRRADVEPHLLFPDADARPAFRAREARRAPRAGFRIGRGVQETVHPGRRGTFRFGMGMARGRQVGQTLDRAQVQCGQSADGRSAARHDDRRLGTCLLYRLPQPPRRLRGGLLGADRLAQGGRPLHPEALQVHGVRLCL